MESFKTYFNEQTEIENLLIEMSDEDFDALLETLDDEELEILEGVFGAIAKGVKAVAKGAGKLAAKGATAAGKAIVKKGKEKFTAKGKADAAERKAAKLASLRKEKERALAAKEKIAKEREALKKLKDREGESSKVATLRDKIKKMAGAVNKQLDKVSKDREKVQQATA